MSGGGYIYIETHTLYFVGPSRGAARTPPRGVHPESGRLCGACRGEDGQSAFDRTPHGKVLELMAQIGCGLEKRGANRDIEAVLDQFVPCFGPGRGSL